MKIWFLYGAPERCGNYMTAFRRAGGRVCAAESMERARLCDALLLPGGGDIHPRRYGQELREAKDIDEERDGAELALVEEFLARGRPVVGICRGLQLLNVYFGGTLHQHVDGHGQRNGQTDCTARIRSLRCFGCFTGRCFSSTAPTIRRWIVWERGFGLCSGRRMVPSRRWSMRSCRSLLFSGIRSVCKLRQGTQKG